MGLSIVALTLEAHNNHIECIITGGIEHGKPSGETDNDVPQ